MKNILGIHFGHNAAAVLLREGKIVAAIEEEKLSRIKGYVGMPYKAMDYVLREGGITMDQVDQVGLAQEHIYEFVYDFTHLTEKIFKIDDPRQIQKARRLCDLKALFPWWDTRGALAKRFYELLEEKTGIPRSKVVPINHHYAHALSAAAASGWDDVLVFTADGKGDGACGSCYHMRNGGMQSIHELPDRFSVGQMYQAVTKFFSFKANRHEGKVTGLAAYGNGEAVRKSLGSILYWENGEPHNAFWANAMFRKAPLRFYGHKKMNRWYMPLRMVKMLHGTLRQYTICHQLYQNYLVKHHEGQKREDVAAGVQALAEEFLLTYVKKWLPTKGSVRVALAGGTFANVKINQRIRELPNVEGIYVQSAMDDAGCALGAAYELSRRSGHDLRTHRTFDPYLGPGYTQEEIRKAVKDAGLKVRDVTDADTVISHELAQGTIVGRYYGRLEWGPRALGNRSIIVRASDPAINDTLNQRLKRSEFMPFAPVVLGEEAEKYLVGYRPLDLAARYMTVTYDVVPERVAEMAAAVHVDGTARPQVIFAEENPEFHSFMKTYHRVSGVPVILNTSFNMHEEPIVDTPQDAIRAYLTGAVDMLHMNGLIIEKA